MTSFSDGNYRRMIRSAPFAAVVTGSLIIGCTSAVSPIPTPTQTRSEPYPIAARVIVGDDPISGGIANAEDGRQLSLAFDADVDRADAERVLRSQIPAAVVLEWLDERTIRFTGATAGERFTLNATGVMGRDRRGTVQMEPASISVPLRLVSIFRVTDLIAGTTQPIRLLRVGANFATLTVNPDGTRALLDPIGPQDRFRTINLASGKVTLVTAPERGAFYSYAGWLPDGRMLLVASSVWIADSTGGNARRIAIGAAQSARPSPTGRYLALWSHVDPGLRILDLVTGSELRSIGPFRRCAQDGGVGIAWSPDETQLAMTDCDDETGQGTRSKLVVPDGSLVGVMPGAFVVDWLPTAMLLSVLPPATSGQEPRYRLLTTSGVVRTELKALTAMPSPDGSRLLLVSIERTGSLGTSRARIVNVGDGSAVDVPKGQAPLAWVARGEFATVSDPK